MIISKLIIFLIMTYEYLGSKREARALQKEWKRVMDDNRAPVTTCDTLFHNIPNDLY